jgi:hypothetical protein
MPMDWQELGWGLWMEMMVRVLKEFCRANKEKNLSKFLCPTIIHGEYII